VVDAGRQRIRELDPEVHGLAADTADLLCGIDLLFVGIELRPLSAVVVRAEIWLCHSVTSGYKNSTLAGA